jgi:hypothetical protein
MKAYNEIRCNEMNNLTITKVSMTRRTTCLKTNSKISSRINRNMRRRRYCSAHRNLKKDREIEVEK